MPHCWKLHVKAHFLPAADVEDLYVFVYVFLTYITSLFLQRQNAVSQVFKTSKYLAAISIGFLVAVSPWNISTLVVAVTNIKLHEDLDFAVSWVAIGNSFWNVVIYSVLNRKFR